MVKRTFWLKRIENAWKRSSIIWLSGVRRAGKTVLCKSIPGVEYFDCELPRVRSVLDDPQSFLNEVKGKRIVLDEIHRLRNPSELLKIAADYYPTTHIIATGSSTLGASAKFKDTLTGRKTELWLTPLMSADLVDFQSPSLKHRFLYGGLPPFFLSQEMPEREIQEWIDSYWAKDIQELFRLQRRYSFQKFVELLMAQSGGIFEATGFAAQCEVSRTTISNFLRILEATFLVNVLRPYSTRRANEIVSAPKVFGFDTGFVCYYRGWYELRAQDMGILWEHYVLNEINAALQSREIRYWRDKQGHEVDFVLTRMGKPPVAIECKWSVKGFDPAGLSAFCRLYPDAQCYVVSDAIDRPYTKELNKIRVRFVSLKSLIELLEK